jgi:hypothetical protein
VRLGELLIADGLVLPAHVERALATPRRRPLRIGSLLVDAGLATADAVARALGRQRTVPAALERHLIGRDPTLAALIPAEFARHNLVLPLARSRDGGIVVALRDPGDTALRAQLTEVLRTSVVAAVACELILRRHVERAYGPLVEAVEDVEVNLDSGPMPVLREDDDVAEELELHDIELGPPSDILDPATVRAGPAHVVTTDFLDPETIRIGSLVSLDDLGVTRDHRETDPATYSRRSAQRGAVAPAMATPPTNPPRGGVVPVHAGDRRSSTPAPRAATPVPAPDSPPAAAELTTTLTRIATATNRDAVSVAVIEHGRGRLPALILLAVRQGMVFGDAGFAPDQNIAAIEAVSLPLNLPSVLKTAVDTARPYAGRPPVGSSIQDRLLKLLGKPPGIVIAPITMSGRVVSLIVAAFESVQAAEATAGELVTIAGACGVAYSRLRS